jgi:hypothetical protein
VTSSVKSRFYIHNSTLTMNNQISMVRPDNFRDLLVEPVPSTLPPLTAANPFNLIRNRGGDIMYMYTVHSFLDIT